MKTAIWWIRRDLRLVDNQALAAAQDEAECVIPLWIRDPVLWRSPYSGHKRRAFLSQGLHRLDESLRDRGSFLLLRKGRPVEVLGRLCEETGAGAIFAEDDVSPYARRRDRAVERALPLRRLPGIAVRAPGSVMKADGDPYVVYSPFARTWRQAPLPRPEEILSAPDRLHTPQNLSGDTWPLPHDDERLARFPAGEQEARRRLQTFLDEGAVQYAGESDRLDQDNTSRLSPYLRLGMISARTVAAAIQQRRERGNLNRQQQQGLSRWLDELIWRDFFIHCLNHFPHARRQSFRAKYRALSWRNDRQQFDAWRHGQTGYPVVDAAMRQLSHTGWIANRARMIVASFLVKDLLVDWRWGERWFMQQLVDGDPALNNGNWQWVAGTGTDAAPYFRIFNPITQGQKHDPDGTYIRRWIPELASVDAPHIHRPWRMSAAEQQAAGCRIGQDYPAPIVNHQDARKETLAAYKSL